MSASSLAAPERAPRLETLDVAKGLLVCLAAIVLGGDIEAAAQAGAIPLPLVRACSLVAWPAFLYFAGLVSGQTAPTLARRVIPDRVFPYVDRFAVAMVCMVGAALIEPSLRTNEPRALLVGLIFLAIPVFETLALRIEAGGLPRLVRIIVLIQGIAILGGAPMAWLGAVALFLCGRLTSRFWNSLVAGVEAVRAQTGFLAIIVVTLSVLAAIGPVPGQAYVVADTALAQTALGYAGVIATLALALVLSGSGVGAAFALLGRGAASLTILWPLLVAIPARYIVPRFAASGAISAPGLLLLGVALALLAVSLPARARRGQGDPRAVRDRRPIAGATRLQIGVDAG
jgi:hypothetical protein